MNKKDGIILDSFRSNVDFDKSQIQCCSKTAFNHIVFPQIQPLKPDEDFARALSGKEIKERLYASIDRHLK